MSHRLPSIESRREFLRGSVRYAMLGAMAAGAVAIAPSWRGGTDTSCINQGPCRDCRIFGRCGLPAALAAKGPATGETTP